MTRALRSRGAVVALLTIGVAATAAGQVVVAPAAQAAGCTGTAGVTVVVQSAAGTSTRCASGDPASAWDALLATGHSVTPVQRFPGAICRIDGYPSSDACVVMPPTSAYWAFFTASAGGSWSYSSAGARAYNPAPGTAVGFRFGGGSAPSVAPPPKQTVPAPTNATAAPVKPPVRTSAPAPRTTSSRSSSTATTAPSRPASASTSATSATPTTSTTPATAPTTTPTTAPATAPTTPATVGTAARSASTQTSSRWPTVLGGVLILGLAAAGCFVARRRSQP